MNNRNLKWELDHGFRHDFIGTAASLVGSLARAGAERRAAEYNVSAANAQAQAARVEARYRAERLRDRHRRIQGAARASIGASGITTEGSPELVLQDNAIEAAMDELAVIRSGESRARGFESQANMYRSVADNAIWGGLLFAGGSGLTAASQMDWGDTDGGGEPGDAGFDYGSVPTAPVAGGY